ncbi:HNH endonuclease domain-containing protein [Tanacetum coccineum]
MTSTSSSSLPRHHTTSKDDRPRFFDSMVKKLCWSKADTVPGRHPDRWRKDAAGNTVCKRFCNCQGCLCFEYDHIVPYSKGGESVVENCQILQTRVNRFKSDKDDVDTTRLRGYSCDINFTELYFTTLASLLFWMITQQTLDHYCRAWTPSRLYCCIHVTSAASNLTLAAYYLRHRRP